MATAATTIAASATLGAFCPATESSSARPLEWEARSSAAILDILSKMIAADDLNSGCHVLAAQLREHLGCERVAVGVNGHGTQSCRLMTVSGVARVDRGAELSRALEGAFSETILRDRVTLWPAAESERHITAAHRKLSGLANAASIVSVPLRGPTGEVVGCCALLGAANELASELNLRFLSAAAPAFGSAVASLRRHEAPAVWQVARRLRAKLGSRRRLVASVAIMVGVVLCLPLRYKVNAQCELQPVTRRYVAAPYAGLFEKSLVKPGDVVARDQVLARMDGREIRWELAGLTAEESRAGKARDVNLAGSKVAAAQIDKLEMQRLDIKRRLLANRAANLEIKSPIDGIVISGDLQRSEGAPLTVGQLLYEIAPLDRMVAELAIDDEDIAYVAVGQSISLRLDAYPGQTWTGTVQFIHPRSQVRETDNVFIAEVLLENQQQALRPGMKGNSKIATDRHTLGWIVLHKPYRRVASWLGW